MKIFEQLKSTNSVKDKEAILRANIKDEQLKQLLKINLSPYILTYTGKIPKYTQSRPPWSSGANNFKKFVELVDRLSNRVVTGSAAKVEVRNFFSYSIPEEAEIYKKILTKAAIGVGISTVNKVWEELVPEFKIMKAPSKLANIVNLKYPLYVQPKLDGFRCIYIPSKGLHSTKGLAFGNKNLEEHFSSLKNTKSCVLDGELYAHGIGFNKLQSILSKKDAKLPTNLKFTVYDCVPIEDWNNKSCKLDYEDRLYNLRVTLNNTIADYKKIIDIANDVAETSKEVKDLYKKALDAGYEGVMIKDAQGKYEWKITSAMLKLKPFESIDLKVEGIYDGEDGFEGKAGGIIVDFAGNAVRCGSGFSIATREDMAAQPNKYIGRTAEIKYLEETEEGSLRHPNFMRWRDDK